MYVCAWSSIRIMEHYNLQILDFPSNTRLSGTESSVSDPSGRGPRFKAHWGNILLLDFFLFSHSKACDATIVFVVLFG